MVSIKLVETTFTIYSIEPATKVEQREFQLNPYFVSEYISYLQK